MENPQWKEIKENIELIKRLLSFGFYFSFTYDLTRNTDKIDVFSAQEKLHDEKFWWNQYMLKDVSSQKISGKWQMPIIQVKNLDFRVNNSITKGFVKNFAVYLMGKKLEFYLISRKSCKKAGTRYNARGLEFIYQ